MTRRKYSSKAGGETLGDSGDAWRRKKAGLAAKSTGARPLLAPRHHALAVVVKVLSKLRRTYNKIKVVTRAPRRIISLMEKK